MNPGWRKRCLRLLSLISGNLRLQSSATTYSQSFYRFPEENYPRSQQTSNHRRLGLFDFSIRCHSCSSTFFEWSYFFLFLFSQINKKGNLLQRYPGAVTTHLSFIIPPSFRLPLTLDWVLAWPFSTNLSTFWLLFHPWSSSSDLCNKPFSNST